MIKKTCRRRITLYPGQLGDIFRLLLKGKYQDYPTIRLFERKIAERFNRKFACSFGSGREAIAQTLRYAADDGTVLVPSWTLGSLVDYLEKNGIKMRLADVNPKNGAMIWDELDPHDIKAVLLTHPFGMPVAMDKWLEYCEKHKIKIVHDCAHGMEAKYKGKYLGEYGYAACFSLELTKELNTFGGGLVVHSDRKLSKALKKSSQSQNFKPLALYSKLIIGLAEEFLVGNEPLFSMIGWHLFSNPQKSEKWVKCYRLFKDKNRKKPFKYTSFQAYMGLCGLKYLNDSQKKRKKAAKIYEKILGNHLIFQPNSKPYDHAYCYLVAFFPNKAHKLSCLARKKGIDLGIKDEIFSRIREKNSYPFEGANKAWYDAILLPMHNRITEKEAKEVAIKLKNIIQSRLIRDK